MIMCPAMMMGMLPSDGNNDDAKWQCALILPSCRSSTMWPTRTNTINMHRFNNRQQHLCNNDHTCMTKQIALDLKRSTAAITAATTMWTINISGITAETARAIRIVRREWWQCNLQSSMQLININKAVSCCAVSDFLLFWWVFLGTVCIVLMPSLYVHWPSCFCYILHTGMTRQK